VHDLLAALGSRDAVDVSRTGSLVTDVLLATSCDEAGASLVTDRARDFVSLQWHLRGFRFAVADDVLES
jgi:hypothetical protein